MMEQPPNQQEEVQEKITLAAIRYKGIIYTGLNHGLAMLDLKKEHSEVTDIEDILPECDGYITSTRRFVSREEAKIIASSNGQLKEKPFLPIDDDQVFSEDIKGLQGYNKKD